MRHPLFSDTQTLVAHAQLPQIPISGEKSERREVAFITGATGFIGGYLLCELIRQKAFMRYICLVRAETQEAGQERLKQSLILKGIEPELLEEVDLITTCGDILKPQFGLSNQDYEHLGHEVDHVYHFAATMNWVTPFNQNTIDNLAALRQAIHLCSDQKTKQLHYASSMGLWTLLQHESEVLREDDFHQIPDQLAGGYFQSKWVAERMLGQVSAQGLPVNIYRIGDVKGCAEDGRGDANNFGNLVMHYFIKTGLAIEKAELEFNFLPVDYVAKAIAYISTSVMGQTFQFTNSELVSFTDISNTLEEEGFNIERHPIGDWRELLSKDKSLLGRTLNAIFRPFSPGADWPATSFYQIGVDMFTKKHDTANTERVISSIGLQPPAMKTDGMLAKYLHHLSSLKHE